MVVGSVQECRCAAFVSPERHPTALLSPSHPTIDDHSQLEATSVTEREDLARCRARLQHLRDLGAPAPDAQIEWNRRRLDCLLVDHMLRGGYNQAAAGLAASANIQVCCVLGSSRQACWG